MDTDSSPLSPRSSLAQEFQNDFRTTGLAWHEPGEHGPLPHVPPDHQSLPSFPALLCTPILALHFATSTLHCVPLCIFTATSTLYNSTLHLPPCIAAPNCVLPVPPSMWPLSRPNPISHWTGHRGLYPETQCSLRTQNTAWSCTCVSHSAIIVEHITIVAFHSCRNTMLVNQLSC